MQQQSPLKKQKGDNFDQTKESCLEYVAKEKAILIKPFDDPAIIAGAGTVGMEILKQTAANIPDIIFCCVGGGGLIAGLAAYIKAIRPDVKIIGVEHDVAAGMTAALKNGGPIALKKVFFFDFLFSNQTWNVCVDNY